MTRPGRPRPTDGLTPGVLLQAFHWYSPDDGSYWRNLGTRAGALAEAGFSALWLPPATKGNGGAFDVGYGVYDLYDLGEFDQKGSVRTRYGTKEDYCKAIRQAQSSGLQCYADIVLNHRMGGDRPQVVRATPFAQNNRLTPSGAPLDIKTYTEFAFPGRAGRYSDFRWDASHFDAVDYDDNNPSGRGMVYLLEGKAFDDYTALENGNFAYLMGCDVDFQNPVVQQELLDWGKWYLDITGVDGLRLDAIKHISSWFFPTWLDAMRAHTGRELFTVGEYWWGDVGTLHWYLNAVSGHMSVFDVPLHFNFHTAGRQGAGYDLRNIFAGSLVAERPMSAVTFVDNHDSQPLQALESVVEPWFKPLAYAMILLRKEGYPCVFLPDYDGAVYEDSGRDGNRYRIIMPSHRFLLDRFLYARRAFSGGAQYDYFASANHIGWTRPGKEKGGMAVILSNSGPVSLWMEVGRPLTEFRDLTGHNTHVTRSNEEGWAPFSCPGGSVSVWIPAEEFPARFETGRGA